MKKKIFLQFLIIPGSLCLLTSCEPSGQLITGGVCACMFTAIGILGSVASVKSSKKATF